MAPGHILVTGATGLVGNNVVRQLLARGARVRVLVRESSDPRPLEGLDVERVCGDICQPDSLKQACQGAHAVIHAAGYVHIGRSNLDVHRTVNVDGTRNVARAARASGARMIHVSSTDAAGVGSLKEPADEDTPLADPMGCSYAITKREAEQVVQEEIARGLDAVIVNPGFMLGPWDWKPSSGRMLLEVARGRALVAPPGHFSVCDVRDVAAGILSAVERGQCGRRYLLAGKTMSYLEAFRLFADVTGGRRPFGCPGVAVSMIGGWIGDLGTLLTGHESDVNSAAVRIARLPKTYSSRRAEQELGYARRPVEESARDAWQWFREHGYG
ncbi:MAG: NAD-dependent epimerase/dehydratase family protein [Planctomycetaceae bacterium]|nr:NAD-dependent epimerase/dehydratase family protein [Planctomycetaceae bacterium]